MQLNKTRWSIIKMLAESDKTPTKLSRELKMSMPAVHIHLNKMEEEKIIHKTSIKGKTRPFHEYSLGNGFIQLIQATPGEARQILMEIDENIKMHLRIWSIPQKEFQAPLEKFWWDIDEYISDIDGVAVYGSVAKGNAREESDIDVLILTEKNIEKIEKKFGAKMYKGKMVMCQVFTPEQFAGTGKFVQQVSNGIVILYDNGSLRRVLDEFKRKTR